MKLSEMIAAGVAAKEAQAKAEETPSRVEEIDETIARALNHGVTVEAKNPDPVIAEADELSRLHGRKREIEDRIKEIKSSVMERVDREELKIGSSVKTSGGDVAYVVRPNGSRFSEIKAIQILTPGELALISVTKPDSQVAKAKLPPDTYKKCCSVGKTTIVLK